MHCIAGNNDVELYLVVGDIYRMSPTFIPPIFNACIKKSKRLYFINVEACFLNSTITITCLSTKGVT